MGGGGVEGSRPSAGTILFSVLKREDNYLCLKVKTFYKPAHAQDQNFSFPFTCVGAGAVVLA